MRKNIYDVLHTGNISLKTEYKRLYSLMHQDEWEVEQELTSIYYLSEHSCKYFDLAFTNRAVSLREIEKAFGYTFSCSPKEITVDYLVSYCELAYNLCYQLGNIYADEQVDKEYLTTVQRNIDDLSEALGYTRAEHSGVFILVEKDSVSLAVAEITDGTLSYAVLEYNHQRLKGNLDKKLGILKMMADDIEPMRKKLKAIAPSIESTLFQLFQKFVRHNYRSHPYIRGLSDREIEECYDDIYQMWLLAKLELDNVERTRKVKRILDEINSSKE